MARYNDKYKSLSHERGKPIIGSDKVDKTKITSEENQPNITLGQDTQLDGLSCLERNVPIRTAISAKAKGKSGRIYSSRSALKDDLVCQLSSQVKMNWNTLEISSKYHERAKSVLYRINLYDLSAVDIAVDESKGIFVINTSDLTPTLRNELEQFKKSDPRGLDEVVTEAVQILLEGINKRYYHTAGLPYKVTWRFES